MPEEGTSTKRGGRKAAAVEKLPDKAESKKRTKKDLKPAAEGGADEASASKRGRGRPKKGGAKKKSPVKAAPKGKSGRGRGKEKAAKSSEDEEEVEDE